MMGGGFKRFDKSLSIFRQENNTIWLTQRIINNILIILV